MAFAIVIGVPLGFFAALKPGSWVDMLSMVFAVSGLSLPMFWLGLLLMYALRADAELAAELRLWRR
jgi:glutathione transport system permease protein